MAAKPGRPEDDHGPDLTPTGHARDRIGRAVRRPAPRRAAVLAQRAVVDDLVTSYLNTIRRANQTIYVLDLSGSMRGSRIEALRSALLALAGGQSKVGSRGFASFRKRERVSLLGYSDKPRRPQVFSIPTEGSSKVLAEIRGAARDFSQAATQRHTPHSGLRTGLRPGRPPPGPVR